jgi:hypothetical protein
MFGFDWLRSRVQDDSLAGDTCSSDRSTHQWGHAPGYHSYKTSPLGKFVGKFFYPSHEWVDSSLDAWVHVAAKIHSLSGSKFFAVP